MPSVFAYNKDPGALCDALREFDYKGKDEVAAACCDAKIAFLHVLPRDWAAIRDTAGSGVVRIRVSTDPDNFHGPTAPYSTPSGALILHLQCSYTALGADDCAHIISELDRWEPGGDASSFIGDSAIRAYFIKSDELGAVVLTILCQGYLAAFGDDTGGADRDILDADDVVHVEEALRAMRWPEACAEARLDATTLEAARCLVRRPSEYWLPALTPVLSQLRAAHECTTPARELIERVASGVDVEPGLVARAFLHLQRSER